MWVSVLRGGRGRRRCCCRVADHNLSEWLRVLKMCVFRSQASLLRARMHATFHKVPECLSSLFLFLHFCLLTHPHTSLLYQSHGLLWRADVDRRNRLLGAESRSVGDSPSLAPADQESPENKGGTVSLGITHFEFQIHLNQSIGNIFMGKRGICWEF